MSESCKLDIAYLFWSKVLLLYSLDTKFDQKIIIWCYWGYPFFQKLGGTTQFLLYRQADIRRYCRHVPISADICRYSPIFADIRRYLPIFGRYLPTFAGPLCWGGPQYGNGHNVRICQRTYWGGPKLSKIIMWTNLHMARIGAP